MTRMHFIIFTSSHLSTEFNDITRFVENQQSIFHFPLCIPNLIFLEPSLKSILFAALNAIENGEYNAYLTTPLVGGRSLSFFLN